MTGPVVACTVWLPSTVMAGSMTRVERRRGSSTGRRVGRSAAFKIFFHSSGPMKLASYSAGSPPYGIHRHRYHAALFLSTVWAATAIASNNQRPATFSTTELGAEPTNLTAAEAK
jgi:hypothetical protein